MLPTLSPTACQELQVWPLPLGFPELERHQLLVPLLASGDRWQVLTGVFMKPLSLGTR